MNRNTLQTLTLALAMALMAMGCQKVKSTREVEAMLTAVRGVGEDLAKEDFNRPSGQAPKIFVEKRKKLIDAFCKRYNKVLRKVRNMLTDDRSKRRIKSIWHALLHLQKVMKGAHTLTQIDIEIYTPNNFYEDTKQALTAMNNQTKEDYEALTRTLAD